MNPKEVFDIENKISAILYAPKIGVFWDVDDYPATDMDIVSFASNVKKAIKNVGYTGKVSITAYSTKKPDELMKGLYDNADIKFSFKASKRAKLVNMLTDMFLWDALARRASGRADGPANMLLISRGILSTECQDEAQDQSFLPSRLYRLHCEGPNMLYVIPDDFPLENLPYRQLYPDDERYPEWKYVNFVWSWSGLLRGDMPFSKEDLLMEAFKQRFA